MSAIDVGSVKTRWKYSTGSRSASLAASVVGAAVTFAVLLLAIHAGSRLRQRTQAIVTRFMGLIVTSMGLQFVLTGFKAFMQAPA